ncbi:MotA/TolQ/ExbB proton channel family protein [Chitinispirillales bacterium ANBcel5]|uniref:MotA/TolQ/ExbB proton channel family protein n=1 Tax=Cellulosispirillum alkaliphilum TaxID=3039283 RepID=UPI002A560C57|nr:MotA/TolQ/ExbB proton channel family protein [Chitinispirillales bacterium ANBcel5]
MEVLAKFFQQGGYWMYPIVAVSAISLAIVIDRVYYLYVHCKIDSRALLFQITRLVRNGEAERASKLCSKLKKPLAIILESAIWHYVQNEPDQEIQNSMDEIALRELPKIQKRTHYLSLSANVSTLLGLLGTIFGLQQAFGALAAADPAQKATVLAQGIAIAMNTTAMGLIVAIPCMVMHSILGAKANAIIEEIDECTVKLLNLLNAQGRS